MSEYCLENNILLAESPRFVDTIVRTPIPFQNVSKVAKEINFDYVTESRANKKSTEDLPPKIKNTIYAFQKEGIQYGL